MTLLPRCLLALLMAVPAWVPGQDLRLVPDIAVAGAEYRDAQDAWFRNDPNLEKDLLKGDREEMRVRIRRAAALRDNLMVKKETYFGFFIQRLEETRKRLQANEQGRLPTEELKRDLEQQQERFLADQERLDTLLRDLPQGDEYFLARRTLEAERSDLINLQNSVALRIRSMEKTAKAQEAISENSTSDHLVHKLDDILKIWTEERSRTVRARASWTRLYTLMERALDGSQPAIEGAVPTNASSKSRKQNKKAREKDESRKK